MFLFVEPLGLLVCEDLRTTGLTHHMLYDVGLRPLLPRQQRPVFRSDERIDVGACALDFATELERGFKREFKVLGRE